ncbi:MAG: hypothetical protein JWO09_1466 [Bacteroidetes bacterium]|nr:hypothetical protein [Bacteroidota bacterium]
MPILKFTNTQKETSIHIRNKSTIRIVNALFSKGFMHSDSLSLDLSFPTLQLSYTLSFANIAAIRDPKQSALHFYQGNGAVFAIPGGASEVFMKLRELKNFDFEFVLSYDFYPGGI